MQQYPEAVMDANRSATPSGSSTPALNLPEIENQLTTLGFRPAHIRSCMTAMSSAYARLHSSSSSLNDPLVLSLSFLSPLEAGIEWLLLHLPEDDLPPRYRPTSSSSDFVTGASAKSGGKDGLVKGWLADKMVKKAGFPRKAVDAVLDGHSEQGAVLDELGRRLCGFEPTPDVWAGDEADTATRDAAREEELLALEAVLGDRFVKHSDTEYSIQLESHTSRDIIHLNFIFDPTSPYPSSQYPESPPPFFISSETIPSYMRLYLHRSLLEQFRDPERYDLRGVLEGGAGGAVLSMVEHLETVLPKVLENPPDVGKVTEHLVPKVEEVKRELSGEVRRKVQKRSNGTAKRKVYSPEEHEGVKRRRDDSFARPAYAKMLADRAKLPAWKERDNIVQALEKSRVLVVVGEVSLPLWFQVGYAADPIRLVVVRGELSVGRYGQMDKADLTVPNSPSSCSITKSPPLAAHPPISSSPSHVESQLWASPPVSPKNGSKMSTRTPRPSVMPSEVNGELVGIRSCSSALLELSCAGWDRVIRI